MDIVDQINMQFQCGQVVFRGKSIPLLLARAFELRDHVDALTAEVARLRARVAELEQAQRWVSVDERLPEPEYTKWCIVQDILRGVYPAYFRDGLWWYSRENERCGIDVEGVVLWRKLPSAITPPEAE